VSYIGQLSQSTRNFRRGNCCVW